MSITQEIKEWLKDAGYKHYCFISYPNTESESLNKIIDRLKKDIFDYLAQSIDNPELFIDKDNIKGGDKWEQSMAEDLCRSVAMLAVITELYYDSNHKWCGWEWYNMLKLSKKRLPNEKFHTIIPVLVRKFDNLPSAIKDIQFCDLSGVIASTKYYYQTNDYHRMIGEIGERIKNIAKSLSKNKADAAGCDNFKIVRRSAFLSVELPKKRQPRYKID